jgi:hypothetical protein
MVIISKKANEALLSFSTLCVCECEAGFSAMNRMKSEIKGFRHWRTWGCACQPSDLAFFNLPRTKHTIKTPLYGSAFFPNSLFHHFQDLCHTFLEIFTKFYGQLLSDPSQNYIRLDTRLQIQGHKNQHVHPAV